MKWSVELFDSTMGLPLSWDRAALQKNAVATIAVTDPSHAFDLMGRMDLPVASDGAIAEDLRSFVAAQVYPAFWKKNRGGDAAFNLIQMQARLIAATGEYPFLGMLPIMQDTMKADEGKGQAIWDEMLTSYSQGSHGILDSNTIFVNALEKAWKTIPPSERARAITQLVDAVRGEAAANSGKGASVYRATADTTKGAYILDSRGYVLLLRLLPQIREVAPRMLEKLSSVPVFLVAQEDAEFQVRSIKEASVHSVDAGSAGNAADAIGAERSMLDKIDELASSNPAQALRMTTHLTYYRDSALSAVTSGMENGKPDLLSALSREAASELDDVKDKTLRLELLAVQAEAGQKLGDTKAEEAVSEGFEIGSALFEEFLQSHPTSAIDQAPQLDVLSTLAKCGVRLAPEPTIARIRRFENPALASWLLIAAARSLNEINNPRPN